jgi:hypothetical protein
MIRILHLAHTIGVMLVIALCVLIARDLYIYYGNEPFSYTYERASVALLCSSFSLAHLWLIASKRLTTSMLLLFYPLCLALGIATALVTRSSAKGWAPSTQHEAFFANIIGYGVIGILVAASTASIYWSLTRTSRHNT